MTLVRKFALRIAPALLTGGRILPVLLAAAMIGAHSADAAQSLREIRAQEAEERALEREAAFTQSVCGIKMTASIDWRSAADWPEDVSLAASCDGALSALEAACRKGAAPRVTRFVCAGDGSGASLRSGALRYGATPGNSGFADVKVELEDG